MQSSRSVQTNRNEIEIPFSPDYVQSELGYLHEFPKQSLHNSVSNQKPIGLQKLAWMCSDWRALRQALISKATQKT